MPLPLSGVDAIVAAIRGISDTLTPTGGEPVESPDVIVPGSKDAVWLEDEYKGEATWDEAYARALAKTNQNAVGPTKVIQFPRLAGSSGNDERIIQFEDTLRVSSNMTLRGQGWLGCLASFENAPADTNGVEFQYDGAGFNHAIVLEDFALIRTPGHGVYADEKLGENSVWDRVYVGAAGKDGIHIRGNGTTPLNMGQLALFGCAEYGLNIHGAEQRTAVQIQYISSDACQAGMLGIQGSHLGGSIKLHSWKCEPKDAAAVVHVRSATNRHIFLGNGYVFLSNDPANNMEYIVDNGTIGFAGFVHWDHIGSNYFEAVQQNPNVIQGLYRDATGTTLDGNTDAHRGPHTQGVPHLTHTEIEALRAQIA